VELFPPPPIILEGLDAFRTTTSPDAASEKSLFDPPIIHKTGSTIHFGPARPALPLQEQLTSSAATVLLTRLPFLQLNSYVPAYATTIYHKYPIRRQRDLARNDRPTT
jgi:hypothetical protein